MLHKADPKKGIFGQDGMGDVYGKSKKKWSKKGAREKGYDLHSSALLRYFKTSSGNVVLVTEAHDLPCGHGIKNLTYACVRSRCCAWWMLAVALALETTNSFWENRAVWIRDLWLKMLKTHFFSFRCARVPRAILPSKDAVQRGILNGVYAC